MKDLTADQYLRSEACKVILELIKAGKKEFNSMDEYKADVEDLVSFMKG